MTLGGVGLGKHLGNRINFTFEAIISERQLVFEAREETQVKKGAFIGSQDFFCAIQSAGSLRRTKMLLSFCRTEAGTGPPTPESIVFLFWLRKCGQRVLIRLHSWLLELALADFWWLGRRSYTQLLWKAQGDGLRGLSSRG